MIHSDRIILRPLVKEDVVLLNKWKNDEDIYKFLGGGFFPTSIDEHAKWMDKLISSDKNLRFIIQTSDNISIGFIGLYDINTINRNCELGIYIGEKEFWGQGYAKEAYMLLEKYASNYLNIMKLKLKVVSSNESAINMYKKLSYYIVGELKKERYIDGKYHNVYIMEKFIGQEINHEYTNT